MCSCAVLTCQCAESPGSRQNKSLIRLLRLASGPCKMNLRACWREMTSSEREQTISSKSQDKVTLSSSIEIKRGTEVCAVGRKRGGAHCALGSTINMPSPAV